MDFVVDTYTTIGKSVLLADRKIFFVFSEDCFVDGAEKIFSEEKRRKTAERVLHILKSLL